MVKEKSGKNKILIIIVSLVVLGVAVFSGVYIGLNKSSKANAPKPLVEAYYELGEIFVNLNENNANRYVKLTATVTYDSEDKDLKAEIESKKVALRDTGIFYFKSLSSADFQPSNEIILKKNLIDKLNANLTTGFILDAKFNELLIQ